MAGEQIMTMMGWHFDVAKQANMVNMDPLLVFGLKLSCVLRSGRYISCVYSLFPIIFIYSHPLPHQEKVYSRSELAIMHEEAMQQGIVLPSQAQALDGGGGDLWNKQNQQDQQLHTGGDLEVHGIKKANRHGALGSEHSLNNKKASVGQR